MNLTEKNVVITLLFVLGISTIFAQSYKQSYEMPPASTDKVIGTVSGTQEAGESFNLYFYKESYIRGLSRWEYQDYKDRRISYSKSELYEKCLSKAKKEYGSSYSNLELRNFEYSSREEALSDYEYYSQVIGSTDKYKKTDRNQRVYYYSATVVVSAY